MDIEVVELKQRLEAGEKFHFIDVREEWEFDQDNLGAMLIPLGELPNKLGDLEAWKEDEIIIHCKSGGRSGQAQKFLQSKGFTNVRNVLGGITKYRTL